VDVITTDEAPQALGPYAQARIHGDTVSLAGQGPLNHRSGEIESSDIRDQTRQTIRNCAAILDAADLDLSDVINTTVFLTDLEDYDGFNEAYENEFDEPYPSRSTVEVSDLIRDGMRVEIEMIAGLP
jgi:2-iminobutanoate/2-iminopropanoate deaminase